MAIKELDFHERLPVVWVDVDKCDPNDWNPNLQDDFIFEKTKISLMEFGWRDPIKVRELDGRLEIVDGEHRWRAAKDILSAELSAEGMWEDKAETYKSRYGSMIPCINYGEVSRDVAAELTLVLNGTRGEPEPLKLAEVMKSLNERIGKAKLTDIMPYRPEYIEEMLQHSNFEPVDMSKQPRLDQKNPVICPECGHEFIPKS